MNFIRRLFLPIFTKFGRLDFLRPGIRKMIIKIFYPPRIGFNLSFDIDFYGFKYNGTLCYDIDYNVFFFGAHDKYEVMFL